MQLPPILGQENEKLILALVEWLVPPCLTLVRKQLKVRQTGRQMGRQTSIRHTWDCYRLYGSNRWFPLSQELVPSSDSNLTRSLMYLFEMLMKEACAEEKAARENKNMKIWIVVRQITFSD